MGRCPMPQLPFLTDKKGNPKKSAPTKISYGCAAVLGTFSNSPLTSVLEHGKMLNPAGGVLA
jgi:hypothetical protein